MKRKMFAVALAVLGMFIARPAQAQTYTYTFTPQYTLSCTGVNQAPLNPTYWYSIGVDGPGQLPEYNELEVNNHVCTTSTIAFPYNDGQATLTAAAGVSTTSQYLGFTIAQPFVPDESAAFIYVQANKWLVPNIDIAISGTTGVTNGMTLDVQSYDESLSLLHDWGNVNFTANVGDTVAFAFWIPRSPSVHHEWFFFHNNSLLSVGNCNVNNSWCPGTDDTGMVGLQLDSIAPDSENVIGVTQIVAGSFSTTHP